MILQETLIERYELKFRIPPELVPPIRRALQRYCVPDAVGGGTYMISSMYLDSFDRQLYSATRTGMGRRFKLRVRRYTSGPYFLELKRRVKDVIRKTRVKIPPSAWPWLVREPRRAVELADLNREGFDDFLGRLRWIGAEPAVVVRYQREAWVSRGDDYARVTFDSKLSAHAADWGPVPINGRGWRPFDQPHRVKMGRSGVVLELKSTTAVPLWMIDLVRRFDLKRTGFSKYATAMEAMRFSRPDALTDLTPARWVR